jgi:hypothetical protein
MSEAGGVPLGKDISLSMNEKYSKESREGYKVVKYVKEVTKVIETTML